MNKPSLQCIALTSGEPAGIGPEIAAMLAAREELACKLVILCDKALLQERAQICGTDARWPDYSPDNDAPVSVLHIPLTAPCEAGELNTGNARYVLNLLDRACDGCVSGEFAAMVTAPIHKGVINDGAALGRFFFGHTEYLAERTKTEQVVMMLAGGGMRVALATTHLPIKEVAAAITADSLTRTLRILQHDLQHKFGIPSPRIIVAGLNPHAGESGHLGTEEIDIIIPVLDQLRQEGMTLIGPLPADTLFNRNILATGDAVLAMYHDQGLPVLKYASFGHGINITLGLPVIRTSVDHGTALDLAGSAR
ncbi:MAG: 4-hydroxythreonine-4-phosphate dehydrogenase PdxA, partial [Iodobacter sp.]